MSRYANATRPAGEANGELVRALIVEDHGRVDGRRAQEDQREVRRARFGRPDPLSSHGQCTHIRHDAEYGHARQQDLAEHAMLAHCMHHPPPRVRRPRHGVPGMGIASSVQMHRRMHPGVNNTGEPVPLASIHGTVRVGGVCDLCGQASGDAGRPARLDNHVRVRPLERKGTIGRQRRRCSPFREWCYRSRRNEDSARCCPPVAPGEHVLDVLADRAEVEKRVPRPIEHLTDYRIQSDAPGCGLCVAERRFCRGKDHRRGRGGARSTALLRFCDGRHLDRISQRRPCPMKLVEQDVEWTDVRLGERLAKQVELRRAVWRREAR